MSTITIQDKQYKVRFDCQVGHLYRRDLYDNPEMVKDSIHSIIGKLKREIYGQDKGDYQLSPVNISATFEAVNYEPVKYKTSYGTDGETRNGLIFTSRKITYLVSSIKLYFNSNYDDGIGIIYSVEKKIDKDGNCHSFSDAYFTDSARKEFDTALRASGLVEEFKKSIDTIREQSFNTRVKSFKTETIEYAKALLAGAESIEERLS